MTEAELRARLALVATALGEVRRQFRAGGRSLPLALEIALRVSEGQEGTEVVSVVDHADSRCMTYEATAAVLQVSQRTVKRLVASGALPVVDVGGCARVRLCDLDQFVRALPARVVA